MMQLRIKELCKNKGITLNQLAEKIGISQPSISGIATGKQKPSFDTLEKLAEALEVSPAELFAKRGDFVAFVRNHGETYTFDTPAALIEYVETLKAL